MRFAKIERNTNETKIEVELNLDGSGQAEIKTGVGFMDHMLDLFLKHGLFDGKIVANGDTWIDDHHTTEDIGIVLGQVFREALGDKKGIKRYGNAFVPMDDALAQVVVDCSNRPHLEYRVTPTLNAKVGTFDTELVQEFLWKFALEARINLHVIVPYGQNTHHIIEAIFKALARALDDAVQIDPRVKGCAINEGAVNVKIGVIDYGMGNLFSVEQALKKLEAEVIITSDKELLQTVDALILPGVGAFPDAMKRLEETALIEFIQATKKPLLGICLGMQLLFEESDEVTPTKGLGIFTGRIKRFEEVSRIPHMGWNNLELQQAPYWLDEQALPRARHVYFVHSFYATAMNDNELVAYADYENVQVPGIVAKANFTGMQFHPEKSGQFGVHLLTAWAKGVMTAC